LVDVTVSWKAGLKESWTVDWDYLMVDCLVYQLVDELVVKMEKMSVDMLVDVLVDPRVDKRVVMDC